jgi:drug/metabolite transporter (DMT)-like permease
MNPTAIGFWRTFIGGLALIILNIIARKTLRVNKVVLFYAALAGFVFAVDLFVWHRSILYIGAGMSTILGNTQVFFTALLAMFIFGEKLSLRYSLSVLKAFIGLILLIDIFNSATLAKTNYVLGVALGIATGISYAIFLIILKWKIGHCFRPTSNRFWYCRCWGLYLKLSDGGQLLMPWAKLIRQRSR